MPEIIIDLKMPVDAAKTVTQRAIETTVTSAEEPHQFIIDVSGDKVTPTALTSEEWKQLEVLMSTVESCLKPESAQSRPKIIFKASHRALDAAGVKALLAAVLGKCDGVDFSDNPLAQAGVAAVVESIVAHYEARHSEASELVSPATEVSRLPLSLLALNNTGLTTGVELEALAKVAQLGELKALYVSHNDFSGVEYNGNPVNPDLLRASVLGRAIWDFLDDGVQYVQIPGKRGSRLTVLDLSECKLSQGMLHHIAAIYEAVIRGDKSKRKGKAGHDHESLTLNLHDRAVKFKKSERQALQLRFIPRDRDTPKGKKGQGGITICDDRGEIVALQKPGRMRRASSAALRSKPADYDAPQIKNSVETVSAMTDSPVAKAEDVLWRQRVLQNVPTAELVQAVTDRLTFYCEDTRVSEPLAWIKLARRVRDEVQAVAEVEYGRDVAIMALVGPLVSAIKQLSTRQSRDELTRKIMSKEEQSLHDELCYIAELTLGVGGFDPKKPYAFTRRMLGLVGAAQTTFEDYTDCNRLYAVSPVTVMRSFAERLAHETDRHGALLWVSLNTGYLVKQRTLLAAHYLRQGRVSSTLEALNILPARELTSLWELQHRIFTEFQQAARSSGKAGSSLNTSELLAAAKLKMGRDPNGLEREILQLLALEEHADKSGFNADTWIEIAERIALSLEEGSVQHKLLQQVITAAKVDTFNTRNAERMIKELRADCTRLLAEVQALANYDYGQDMVDRAERSAAGYGRPAAVAFVKPLCWAIYDERRTANAGPTSVATESGGRKRAHSVGAGAAGASYDRRVVRVRDEYPFHILGNTIEMTVAAATAAPLPPPIASAPGVGSSEAGGSGERADSSAATRVRSASVPVSAPSVGAAAGSSEAAGSSVPRGPANPVYLGDYIAEAITKRSATASVPRPVAAASSTEARVGAAAGSSGGHPGSSRAVHLDDLRAQAEAKGLRKASSATAEPMSPERTEDSSESDDSDDCDTPVRMVKALLKSRAAAVASMKTTSAKEGTADSSLPPRPSRLSPGTAGLVGASGGPLAGGSDERKPLPHVPVDADTATGAPLPPAATRE